MRWQCCKCQRVVDSRLVVVQRWGKLSNQTPSVIVVRRKLYSQSQQIMFQQYKSDRLQKCTVCNNARDMNTTPWTQSIQLWRKQDTCDKIYSQWDGHLPHQLSLAIPPWVRAISNSKSWDVNRHTTRCTIPVSMVWQCKLVSGWGLMKWRSAPLYGPYGSERTLSFTLGDGTHGLKAALIVSAIA